MILDFLVSLGIFFSGSVLIDGFTFLSNISDYSGYSDYLTGCFNYIINYFSGFFRGTPPVEVDVIINGENILENGNLENGNLIYGNENLMLENQDTINLIVETVNLTLENQETENLTLENQETENLTLENQETENLTLENQETENLTLENQDTENSVISSLINKGGKVYDNSHTLLLDYDLLNGNVDNIPSSIISSFNNSYSNISHMRHSDTSILSEESINLKVAEFNDKPAKCVRLPDFCSFKGFSEKKFQTVMKGIYKNEQPLLNTLNRCGYGTLENYLFYEDENFEFTFNDENTVKYVMENLDIFKAYTHLPFRLGMLHELSELERNRLDSGNLRDLKGHVAMCHTVDVCTALYKSIQEIPKVSIGNFGDLYDNDEEFEKLVDCFDNDLTISDLLDSDKFPGYIGTSIYAELLNSILDKLYTKNNDLS